MSASAPPEPDPVFFSSPSELRAWLETHHAAADVAWIGFWKKATGRPCITWPELVDELLCFGWIDGLRRSIDEESWMIRITPRRPRSDWSEVNRRRIAELLAEGRVAPAGRAAFERWAERGAGKRETRGPAAMPGPGTGSGPTVASQLSPELEARFRADPAAWEYWQGASGSYRSTVARWVMSAKREETRLRRLDRLIADSAAGLRIREMRR